MLSSPPPDTWITRAQVWLGTLVEVALPAIEASDARFAVAFNAIAHVHRTMSAHETTSDLAQIARLAHVQPVFVDAGTAAVLHLAQALWRESEGAFDVTIAPVLARDGQLPAHASGRATCGGLMDALQLGPETRVRAAVPVAIDLGGIAKGFAVDKAVAALRAAGASMGRVNAGGDQRVFGAAHWVPIQVRDPALPSRFFHLFDLRDAAAATSADYFREGSDVLVEPRSQGLRSFAGSITVVAPTCAVADALTKIVALRPAESVAIMARHGAHAFRLDHGDAQAITTWPDAISASAGAHLRLAA